MQRGIYMFRQIVIALLIGAAAGLSFAAKISASFLRQLKISLI